MIVVFVRQKDSGRALQVLQMLLSQTFLGNPDKQAQMLTQTLMSLKNRNSQTHVSFCGPDRNRPDSEFILRLFCLSH